MVRIIAMMNVQVNANEYYKLKRNWYDIISIILLITVICTHIADVCNHSELLAIWHNRIFAISVIVVSMRAFEIGRFVNKVFLNKAEF